jgi:Fe-S-cluster containining protein
VTAVDLPSAEPEAACAFLAGGLCGLYRFRPLICRTHGLPVAFLNDAAPSDAASPPEVNVSFCPKNFAAVDPDGFEFGPDNTLDLDGLNAELAEADERFADEQARSGGGRPAGHALQPVPWRVPLRQLRQDLRPGET